MEHVTPVDVADSPTGYVPAVSDVATEPALPVVAGSVGGALGQRGGSSRMRGTDPDGRS